MPESFLKGHLPSWLTYAMTVTGLTGLTGVILLYMYQCKLIYPASYPEGSRQEVSYLECALFYLIYIDSLSLKKLKRLQCPLILACSIPKKI